MASSDYVQIAFDGNGNIVKDNKFTLNGLDFSLYKKNIYVEQNKQNIMAIHGTSEIYFQRIQIKIKSHDNVLTKNEWGVPSFNTFFISYYNDKGKTIRYSGILASGYYNFDHLLKKRFKVPMEYFVNHSISNYNRIGKNYKPNGEWYDLLTFQNPNDTDPRTREMEQIDISEYRDLFGVHSWCGIIPEQLKVLKEDIKSWNYFRDKYHTKIPTKLKNFNKDTPLIGLFLGNKTNRKKLNAAIKKLKRDTK